MILNTSSRRVNLYFYFIFFIASLELTQATLYVFRYTGNNLPRTPRSLKSYSTADEQGIIKKKTHIKDVLKLIKKHNAIVEETRDNCVRLFGSIYGTKDEKIKCLEILKKSKLKRDKLKAEVLGKTRNKNQFVDLTRVSMNSDEKPFNSLQLPNSFSTDYIDFGDLRSRLLEDKAKHVAKYVDAQPYWQNHRKSSHHSNKRYKKSKRQLKEARTEYSSSDEDDLNESVPYTKKKSLKYYKKPKRFQVIKNDEESSNVGSFEERNDFNAPKDNKVELSKQDTDSSNEEVKTPMKIPKKDISFESSPEADVKPKPKPKYVKPLKARDYNKKDLYLQGHRVVDMNSRRRLPTFLPKRFHWDQDEIHDLGYYWFNGPQGKYPNIPMRP